MLVPIDNDRSIYLPWDLLDLLSGHYEPSDLFIGIDEWLYLNSMHTFVFYNGQAIVILKTYCEVVHHFILDFETNMIQNCVSFIMESINNLSHIWCLGFHSSHAWPSCGSCFSILISNRYLIYIKLKFLCITRTLYEINIHKTQ